MRFRLGSIFMHPATSSCFGMLMVAVLLMAGAAVGQDRSKESVVIGKEKFGVQPTVRIVESSLRGIPLRQCLVSLSATPEYQNDLVRPISQQEQLRLDVTDNAGKKVPGLKVMQPFGREVSMHLSRGRVIRNQLRWPPNGRSEPISTVAFDPDEVFSVREPGEYRLVVEVRLLQEQKGSKQLKLVTFDPISVPVILRAVSK